MKIITTSVGERREGVLPLPLGYTVFVGRSDGYAPSDAEILVVLELARTNIQSTPMKKTRAKPKH